MSGEAGAGATSQYFQIFYSSGMTVSVATPPYEEENPHYISDYFKEANKPFEQKLNKTLPMLETMISEYILKYNIPIVSYESDASHVHGVIIEDVKGEEDNVIDGHNAENWFAKTNNAKAFISFCFFTKSFAKVTLSFVVNRRILRSQLHLIRDEILKIL